MELRPELPFLVAGLTSIVGGVIKEKKWPKDTGRVVIGTAVLVVVASATTNTKIAPLIHAIGLLLLLSTVMATVRYTQKK